MEPSCPKSQVLQVAAFGPPVVAAAAGGLPLALLGGMVSVLYLIGGTYVDVDCAAGRRTPWRFAGLRLSAVDTPLRICRLVLRPEWMARSSGDGYVARKGSMVYDLVLVGSSSGGDDGEVVAELRCVAKEPLRMLRPGYVARGRQGPQRRTVDLLVAGRPAPMS